MSERPPTKNDIELAKIFAISQRWLHIMGLVRHLLALIAIVSCTYIFFEGVKPVIARDATALRALAQVVRAFRLDTIVATLAAGFFGVAWRLERKGKKRALSKKSEYQKKLESLDPYRSSSDEPPII